MTPPNRPLLALVQDTAIRIKLIRFYTLELALTVRPKSPDWLALQPRAELFANWQPKQLPAHGEYEAHFV